MYICPTCQKSIHPDVVNHVLSEALCPICCSNVFTIETPVSLEAYTDLLPDADQLRYMKHIIEKQQAKVEHARKQLHTIITKIDIMSELVNEREQKHERK